MSRDLAKTAASLLGEPLQKSTPCEMSTLARVSSSTWKSLQSLLTGNGDFSLFQNLECIHGASCTTSVISMDFLLFPSHNLACPRMEFVYKKKGNGRACS